MEKSHQKNKKEKQINKKNKNELKKKRKYLTNNLKKVGYFERKKVKVNERKNL